MESFQVLDRRQNIHQNYLLEASAGTGKTFSIENIVVRRLVEDAPLNIEEILVVTFTRAATRDLKMRIHANIEKTITLLDDPQDETLPDYLVSFVEQGETNKTKKRLERALLFFDQAQIFTIHSFCSQMLNENVFEGNVRLDAISMEDPFNKNKMIGLIHDVFRSKMTSEQYSQSELKLLLQTHQGDLEKLENALVNVLSKGTDIEAVPSFADQLEQFKCEMSRLKEQEGLTSERILEDFMLQAPCYRGLCDRSGQIKPDVIERVKCFAALFEKSFWDAEDLNWLINDQLFLPKAIHPDLVMVRKTPPKPEALHYPELLTLLNERLSPLVNPLVCFARLARDCQKLFRQYQEQEETFGYDDILKAMLQALNNKAFIQKVRSRYKAAIIDEFQDTDPLQWEIFEKLFLNWGNLYLVGDPKQSIYAFRQADIYTYLDAAKKIGPNHQASLDTNYRSQPPLVAALNSLFSAAQDFLPLPRLDRTLHYPEVKSSPAVTPMTFDDNRGAVHFCIAQDLEAKRFPLEKLEKEHFFPFMVQEIQRLSKEHGIAYHQFAILVADRFQSKRVEEYLKQWNIPSMTQRGKNLGEASALPALKELLKGVLHPKNESALKTALGGKIIQWTHDDVRKLEDRSKLEEILYRFFSLRRTLLDQGLAAFYQELLHTRWHTDSLTVIERLLSQNDDGEFYDALQQIMERLFELYQRHSPESLVELLDEIKMAQKDDENAAKQIVDSSMSAVNIMTLHASKGLEFDIVFTLGLVKRSRSPDMLIPSQPCPLGQGNDLSGRGLDPSHPNFEKTPPLREGSPNASPRREDQRLLRIVSDKNAPEYQQHRMEIDAEKLRQLYVAMTRAKYRLYNPVVIAPKANNIEQGCASPMELFLAKLSDDLQAFCDQAEISYTLLNDTPSILKNYVEQTEVSLAPPGTVHVPGKKKFMHSFTSLSKSQSTIKPRTSNPPHDFSIANKTPHTLPAGSETGTLLHHFLETYPLESEAYIRDHLRDTKFQDWESVIVEIITNAMQTPLQDGLRIGDLPPHKCYREPEFLYASQDDQAPGYLKGFIDLIFEHQGKYFLLDWKSNWLGPSIDDYVPDNLKTAMEEHHYLLQARLYTEALRKYLALVQDKPFEEIFGGAYYIFLRGLNPAHGNTFGVYHLNKELYV